MVRSYLHLPIHPRAPAALFDSNASPELAEHWLLPSSHPQMTPNAAAASIPMPLQMTNETLLPENLEELADRALISNSEEEESSERAREAMVGVRAGLFASSFSIAQVRFAPYSSSWSAAKARSLCTAACRAFCALQANCCAANHLQVAVCGLCCAGHPCTRSCQVYRKRW